MGGKQNSTTSTESANRLILRRRCLFTSLRKSDVKAYVEITRRAWSLYQLIVRFSSNIQSVPV
jgi:hypothetical protein